jgi:hypothetical protein
VKPVQDAKRAARGLELGLELTRGDEFVSTAWTARPTTVLGTIAPEGGPRTISTGRLEIAVGQSRKAPFVAIKADGRSQITIELQKPEGRYAGTTVTIGRLDPTSAYPQVALNYFNGGAHGATYTRFATEVRGRWRVVDIGWWDGGGLFFGDLFGRGYADALWGSADFQKAFDLNWATAGPPAFFRLRGDRFLNVTNAPEFIPLLRRKALADAALATPDEWRDNEFLARWVVEKAMIGEGREAWELAMAKYVKENDRGYDWCPKPTESCPTGTKDENGFPEQAIHHLTFPEALMTFLKFEGFKIPGVTTL